jgi:hypothetical protein
LEKGENPLLTLRSSHSKRFPPAYQGKNAGNLVIRVVRVSK